MAKKADLVDSGAEIVKAEKKKPRGGNNFLTDAALKVEDGDNTKYLMANVELMNMSDIDIKDPEAVRQRINDYFKLYAQYDMKPTVAGLGMALGLDRRRLWEIKVDAPVGGHGEQHLPSETVDSIKKAYKLMENLWETYMNSGKINPVSGIFLGKNNFGYQDKTEYVLTPNQKNESDYDAEDIRKRYLSDSATINADE
jgi:hypothetical protein